jgi:hypothetical protein
MDLNMTLVVFLVAYGAARQHGSFFFVWLCTFLFAGITSLFVYILHWFIKAVFFSVKKGTNTNTTIFYRHN